MCHFLFPGTNNFIIYENFHQSFPWSILTCMQGFSNNNPQQHCCWGGKIGAALEGTGQAMWLSHSQVISRMAHKKLRAVSTHLSEVFLLSNICFPITRAIPKAALTPLKRRTEEVERVGGWLHHLYFRIYLGYIIIPQRYLVIGVCQASELLLVGCWH